MLREERKKGESTEISMNKQDVMNRLYGYYTRLTAYWRPWSERMRNFDDRAAKRASQQGEGIDRQLVRLFQPAIAKFRREPAVYAVVVEHVFAGVQLA